MTVAELILILKELPQDKHVYRWDSERQSDGSETVFIKTVQVETVDLYHPHTAERVVLT